jgi:hypothetical protein
LLSYYGGVRVRYLESKTIFRMGHFFFLLLRRHTGQSLADFLLFAGGFFSFFFATEVRPRIIFYLCCVPINSLKGRGERGDFFLLYIILGLFATNGLFCCWTGWMDG